MSEEVERRHEWFLVAGRWTHQRATYTATPEGWQLEADDASLGLRASGPTQVAAVRAFNVALQAYKPKPRASR